MARKNKQTNKQSLSHDHKKIRKKINMTTKKEKPDKKKEKINK